MRQRIEHAIRQALTARERAEACMDIQVREQWLQVAGMWDEFAGTCEKFQKVRDAAMSAIIPGQSRAYPPQ